MAKSRVRWVMGLLQVLGVWALGASAQRLPVLKQIDEPHSYYYREMFLPQLTSGPSAVTWSPDSQEVIYSMQGSLWRQRLDADTAQQLTAGPGYDYQPDWSPDGRWVVFVRYDNDALELWLLDLKSGEMRALTQGANVNVAPRWSPDGKRIAYVSTAFNRHFHIFVMDVEEGRVSRTAQMTQETRTSLPRFYYSVFDHEISPTWSADGKELVFISNRGHLYGTGGFWKMKAEPGAPAREIRYEETTWRAQPEIAPDGKRMVYASYLGRAWHQLWLGTAKGGDVFPITYGEYDNTGPRWSRDGKRIAFISNRGGNTALWVMEALGGGQREIKIAERRYLKPVGRLRLTVVGTDGKPVWARASVTGEDGRAYGPDDRWMHADASFDRAQRKFEAHYFHSPGVVTLTVPAGKISVEVMKGLEYEFERRTVVVAQGKTAEVRVQLKPLAIPLEAGKRWISADVHVHMNYAGVYRNAPQHMIEQQAAENVNLVEALVVNKEQRIPDMAYFATVPDRASTADQMLVYGQEYHTSYWGHLGLLNLSEHYLLPEYAAYTNTAAASLYPDNVAIADLAHAQKGLVGYVHPFDEPMDPAKPMTVLDELQQDIALELPVDVALGKVDYMEVMGFSDHKSTAEIWYRLLNCGFRLPTAAGTDAMANFASLRGPVGLNRVYVQAPAGKVSTRPLYEAIRKGDTFATNAPLLGFTLNGQRPGAEVRLPSGGGTVKLAGWLRSIVPVDHAQVICNGEMVKDLALASDRRRGDFSGTIEIQQSGWCLLRAYSDRAEYPILDGYVYGTTSPVYVKVEGTSLPSKEAAGYFLAWVDRLKEAAEKFTDWTTEQEKATVLEHLKDARARYETLAR